MNCSLCYLLVRPVTSVDGSCRSWSLVRCLARRPEHLDSRVGPDTKVVKGDMLDAGSLADAFDGIDVAYYLVHSMGSSGSFEEQDRTAAKNFANAAREAGVKRIIYLGGLGMRSA